MRSKESASKSTAKKAPKKRVSKDSETSKQIKRGREILQVLEDFDTDSWAKAGSSFDEYGSKKPVGRNTHQKNRKLAINSFLDRNVGISEEQAENALLLAEILARPELASKKDLIEVIESGKLKLRIKDLKVLANKNKNLVEELRNLLNQQVN